MPQDVAEREADESRMFKSDDTVVVKFVDSAIYGKSEAAEDPRHLGLVEPTVNMKEAMNAINSMFAEPLEMASVGRGGSHRSHPKKDSNLNGGFEVFVDENLDNKTELEKQERSTVPHHGSISQPRQPEQPPFMIFVDDEAGGEIGNTSYEKDGSKSSESRDFVGGSTTSASRANAFVFPCVENLEDVDDPDIQDPIQAKFREDTIVCRFVGTAISHEPEVENICHHGLVEPTVNLKEAMDDINNMFGEPIEFVRTGRSKKHAKPPEVHNDFGGFSILPDDDLEPVQAQPPVKSSGKSKERDLFEPTVFTKEAMDDINKMFGMPLDF